MRKKLFLVSWMMTLLLLSSCNSSKYVYWKDLEPFKEYPAGTRYEATIHRNDRLAIVVNSRNPELVIPFNMQGGGFKIASDGSVDAGSGVPSVGSGKGYRVDVNGDIEFPILGKLHLEGLTVSHATKLIKEKIEQGNYIKDPLVSIEFLNFKYTVLGAVGHTGMFSVDDDRITLVEAIAKAGDLAPNARIDRVEVIRVKDGVRQSFVHDLRSKDIFDSPAYYLQQNDIVYVEPKYKKKSTEDRGIQYGTLFLSAVTAICSIFWVLR